MPDTTIHFKMKVGQMYDDVILADNPVGYWAMTGTISENDLTNRGHTGTYKGGQPQQAKLPNGDIAAVFDGIQKYLAIPSSPDFSIPTTHKLTWEAWICPTVLQWTNKSDPYAYGYVDFMGKCQDYGPTCEWEARMYATKNSENRPNRISAYVFNPSAGLGSAADWQPVANLIQQGQWYHVVGEYQTITTPAPCKSAYPGTIDIWVNGVKWNFKSHAPTGCMSQYRIVPRRNSSPLNIGTMAFDTWFPGSIGKVAIYNYLLTQDQITNHFSTMIGYTPIGSCTDTCHF